MPNGLNGLSVDIISRGSETVKDLYVATFPSYLERLDGFGRHVLVQATIRYAPDLHHVDAEDVMLDAKTCQEDHILTRAVNGPQPLAVFLMRRMGVGPGKEFNVMPFGEWMKYQQSALESGSMSGEEAYLGHNTLRDLSDGERDDPFTVATCLGLTIPDELGNRYGTNHQLSWAQAEENTPDGFPY